MQAAWPISYTQLQRKRAVQDTCRNIGFDRLQLFRDTVTKVVLSSEHDIAALGTLPVIIIQTRTMSKPSFTTDGTTPGETHLEYAIHPMILITGRLPYFSGIRKEKQLAAGVYTAYRGQLLYVCKEIDRERTDTAILVQELHNLSLLNGSKYFVQLVAVVVSSNPYPTAETDGSLVVRGLLLEYHPNGTLEDALRSVDQSVRRPWRQWRFRSRFDLGNSSP